MVQKMDIPKTYKEVIARFKQAPDEIQKYFTPPLVIWEQHILDHHLMNRKYLPIKKKQRIE
jgi:hypothetical protein